MFICGCFCGRHFLDSEVNNGLLERCTLKNHK